ncbi:hypothetical protein TM7_0021 [candidate division TM7 genomosp. GTL1]|nr:hypothetical protein TM7_0021 [candidate division TM7 genomosp. GTL1]
MSKLSPDALGFVLAIDGCARGCHHCPAYGLGMRPTVAPIEDLRTRLKRIKAAMPTVDFANDFRTVHAWRISDLGDYRYTEGGVTYDVVSVAEAWYANLGQPLYVVTNGTIGSKARRESLQLLSEQPDLVSQVKLTITPFDPKFTRTRYVENMAFDVATLWPLGELPGRRKEGSSDQRRFRINVKSSADQRDEVEEVLWDILSTAGLPNGEIEKLMTNKDPRLQIKPVYDLRVTAEQPLPIGALQLGNSPTDRLKPETVRNQNQLGFRPDGSAFEVDLWAFRETDIPEQSFDDWF